jgi:hypothetical protein
VAFLDLLRKRRVSFAVVVIASTALVVAALARRAREPEASIPQPIDRAGAVAARPAPPVAHGPVDTSRANDAGAGVADERAPAIDRVAALRRGLASEDVATRIAAIEAVVGSTAVETLGELENFELARDPEAAPTVIHAIALLGASAEGTKRDDAASTLERWLRAELRREGPDVPGNVSNLVEALGDVGGREAVDALSAALDRAEVALHVQTLAVQKLGELGDTRARGSVERFAKRVAAMPAAEGIDEELRVEAAQAAQATLTRI